MGSSVADEMKADDKSRNSGGRRAELVGATAANESRDEAAAAEAQAKTTPAPEPSQATPVPKATSPRAVQGAPGASWCCGTCQTAFVAQRKPTIYRRSLACLLIRPFESRTACLSEMM